MEMNSYFAVSIDLYNKKEYIIRYENGTAVQDTRQLGTCLFDNEWLLTDDFFQAQRHLSLNKMHGYSAYNVLKKSCDPETACDPAEELRMFYSEDRLYIAAESSTDLTLFRYYLDTIYAAGLFPRRCSDCGKLLIGKTHLFDVLCSECRKRRDYEKNIRYRENHDNEFETMYRKVYQRWYTRIRRAKKSKELPEDKLKSCADAFFKYASESKEIRHNVNCGEISPDDFSRWIDNFEASMKLKLYI